MRVALSSPFRLRKASKGVVVRSRFFHVAFALALAAPAILAQQAAAPTGSTFLTILNENFAVAQTELDLDLQAGPNNLTTSQVTARLEPNSVVLRDRALRPATFHVVELTYNPGPGGESEAGFEGMRAMPNPLEGPRSKPTLQWQIDSEKAQDLHADLVYVTGGLSWQAAYNAIISETSQAAGEQRADILGWVTLRNHAGADFPAARVRLMASESGKTPPEDFRPRGTATGIEAEENQIGQKSSEDFHFYDLGQMVRLAQGEVKEVEFLSAAGVNLSRAYVYDGASTNRERSYGGRVNEEQEYGLDETRTKVNIAEEFRNTTANHLGVPLPSGRLRLYRQTAGGQVDFIGEAIIPHSPSGDSVKIVSGDAPDVSGARTQTDFHVNGNGRTVDESFQIKLANHRAEPIAVTIVEHLYRGNTWDIAEKSAGYTKVDSHTIQFPVQVAAHGESTLTYSVRYSW